MAKETKKVEATIKNAGREKLELTPIKNTPFNHATNGEKNYLITGKVILETNKTLEETRHWLQEKPWEAIAMMVQAIVTEMTSENSQK